MVKQVSPNAVTVPTPIGLGKALGKSVAEYTPIDLDALLTPPECAKWMQMEERTLLANARRKRIPVVKVNDRVLRFHPRSILAAKGVKL